MEATNINEPNKCSSCTIFYSNPAFNGLCSQCYKKKEVISQKIINQTRTQQSLQDRKLSEQFAGLSIKEQQKDKKRCFDCNKKVGLLGVECKCGYIYCNGHRLPQNHKCLFDHKDNKKLAQKLNKVYNGKIQSI